MSFDSHLLFRNVFASWQRQSLAPFAVCRQYYSSVTCYQRFIWILIFPWISTSSMLIEMWFAKGEPIHWNMDTESGTHRSCSCSALFDLVKLFGVEHQIHYLRALMRYPAFNPFHFNCTTNNETLTKYLSTDSTRDYQFRPQTFWTTFAHP